MAAARVAVSDSGTTRNARSPSSSVAIPDIPNDSSDPNDGSSTISSTHEIPFGAIRWT